MKRPEFHDGTLSSQIAPLGETTVQTGAKRAIRRAVIATGIVTPYTHRIYEGLAANHGIDLHVFACAPTEPNRHWQLQEARNYRREVMRGFRWHRPNERNVYLNPGIVAEILKLRPDVLIVGDFSPTMLVAAATARLAGIPVAMTSNTIPGSDPGETSTLHRLSRQIMGRMVGSVIGGSEATLEVLARYGIGVGRGALRPVVPGWDYDGPIPSRDERPYDLLYCGTIEDRRKAVLHILETVRALTERGRKPRIRVVGEGPQRQQLEDGFSALGIDARFDGYLQQDALAEAYLSSKLLLFPTRSDPWGIVANEAAQCGTPILISPHAQAAFGLVERFQAGAVLPLDVAAWADAVEHYLDDRTAWQRASEGGLVARKHLTLDAAVRGFVRGMEMARSA